MLDEITDPFPNLGGAAHFINMQLLIHIWMQII